MEKDYSLLRPFDPEAAKRGEFLTWRDGLGVLKYLGEPVQGLQDEFGVDLILQWEDTDRAGKIGCYEHSVIRMAPLCWVEGKPVYKGDVLYQNTPALTEARVVVSGNEDGITDDQGRWNGRCHLTWTPPKMKREVNLLAYLTGENLVWKLVGVEVPDFYIRVPSEDKVIVVEE